MIKKISLIVLTMIFAWPTAVFALDLKSKNVPALTKLELLPQEKFEKQTRLVEVTPFADEGLAFKMRLPQYWAEDKDAITDKKLDIINKKILGVLAKYQSPVAPNKPRSYILIEALDLTYEINAKDWLSDYVIANGLTLLEVAARSKSEVEAMYVDVRVDQTFHVRLKAIINGSRIVLVRYFVPQRLYLEKRARQAQVLNSFELVNQSLEGVEDTKDYGFLDQSFMSYPSSWRLQKYKINNIERMRAILYNYNKTRLDGQINIFLSNKMLETTRGKEVMFYRDKLKVENYALGKLIERVDLQYHKDMSFGATEVYEMNSTRFDMINYELWISVIENDDYFYITALRTPTRDEDFFVWARNVEAYKIVVKNLRRYGND